jgi:hypothetical protein
VTDLSAGDCCVAECRVYLVQGRASKTSIDILVVSRLVVNTPAVSLVIKEQCSYQDYP